MGTKHKKTRKKPQNSHKVEWTFGGHLWLTIMLLVILTFKIETCNKNQTALSLCQLEHAVYYLQWQPWSYNERQRLTTKAVIPKFQSVFQLELEKMSEHNIKHDYPLRVTKVKLVTAWYFYIFDERGYFLVLFQFIMKRWGRNILCIYCLTPTCYFKLNHLSAKFRII